jgi:hypothetical protein
VELGVRDWNRGAGRSWEFELPGQVVRLVWWRGFVVLYRTCLAQWKLCVLARCAIEGMAGFGRMARMAGVDKGLKQTGGAFRVRRIPRVYGLGER